MESEGPKSISNFALGPPWLFRGSAIYQLLLVKAETARSFIPKELKLVEAFGYTLGGFFLARYDSSPAGKFDELVVIPGIVWNPPTSCAWAARVLVSSEEACLHGRKEVGLPSHVATFFERSQQNLNNTSKLAHGLFNILGISPTFSEEHTKLQISESHGSLMKPFCNITLPFGDLGARPSKQWAGPRISMSLPSFSGKTEYNRDLLKYSCQIECRIKLVKPVKVSQSLEGVADTPDDYGAEIYGGLGSLSTDCDARNRCISVLLSKPILTMKFSSLKMQVEAPKIIVPYPERSLEDRNS